MKKRMEILSNEIIYQSNRITEDLNEQLVEIVYFMMDLCKTLTCFPTIATRNARDKQCHWLVRAPYLLSIIGALFASTFSTSECVSHGFQLLFKFVFISDAFGFN